MASKLLAVCIPDENQMTSLLNLVYLIVYLLCIITPSIPIVSAFLFWKRKWRFALMTLLLFLFSCSFILIYWDGYYLPFKPCRPFTYPEKRVNAIEGEDYSQITSDPLELVLSFYDEQLIPSRSPDDTGLWIKEKTNDFEYLYWCISGDINFHTTETGCIYLNENEQGTHIRTHFLRSEGASWACPRS